MLSPAAEVTALAPLPGLCRGEVVTLCVSPKGSGREARSSPLLLSDAGETLLRVLAPGVRSGEGAVSERCGGLPAAT